MMRVRIIALAGCLLAGCAATTDQATRSTVPIPPPSTTGTSACFYAEQAQSFRLLDARNLIVFAPDERRAYHVRISPASPSRDLRFAESVAFEPANGRICGYAFDRLVIGRGSSAQGVSVLDVSRLTPDSLAALRAGTEGKAIPAARPQPGPGAAIEGTSGLDATEKPGK